MHPYHDTLIRHPRDVDTVIAAGANVSPMWTALRARIDARADAETMLQRYTTVLLTGEGDLTALRAAALAEVTAGSVNAAAVENAALAIAGRKLVELYASSAAEVYSHCAARFDAAALRSSARSA